MAIKIKSEALTDILESISRHDFYTDGCACGDWGYRLNEHLHMYVYRSCRKSNNIPDEKLWHIHDIHFYKRLNYCSDSEGNIIEIEVYDEDEDYLENTKLDTQQSEIIIRALKNKTKEVWGNEYRDQDLYE